MAFTLPLSWLSWVFLLSGGLLLTVGLFTIRAGKRTKVRDWFLVLLAADALWALSSIGPLEAGTVTVAVVSEAIRLGASSAAAICWLCFALVYTGRAAVLTRRRIAALVTPFVIHVVAFATNPLHGLSVRGFTASVGQATTVVTYEFGPLYRVVTVYALILTVLGTALVITTALTDPDLYADQSIALFVGSSMPIAGVLISVLTPVEFGSTNLTPALLSLTAISYGYALFRGNLLAAGPLIAATGQDVAVESLEEGFIIADGQGQIVEANAAARTLLNEPSITGCALAEVFTDGLADDSDSQVIRIDDGTVVEAQVTSLSDQQRRGDTGSVVTLRDVTEQRRQQERLEVLNRVLRHNISNNLQTVRGYAEHLADEKTESIETDAAARTILGATDDLLGTVEKARSVEQLFGSGTTPERVALDTLLVEEAAKVSERAATSVTVETEFQACTIRSREPIIRLIVGELLDNAVRHDDSPPTHIELSLSLAEQVEIRVADNGPGIPALERETVRSGTETRLAHSSGIGLWTVRWGSRSLGGSFAIDDSPETGTVVTVRLPRRSGDASSP